MNKKIVFVFILCILHGIIYAQDTPVKLSDKFAVSVGPVYPWMESKFKYYFSLEEHYSIAVKRVGDNVVVQKFDNVTMEKISEMTYTDLGRHQVQRVMPSGDRIYYIYGAFDKVDKKATLYARTITKEGIMLPVQKLCATASDMRDIGYVSIDAVSGMAPIRYEISESYDKSKIMARYKLAKLSVIDSKNYEGFGFQVFDAKSLERQWGGEIQMPYSEKDMNNLAFSVSNTGIVNLITYVSTLKEFQLMVFDKSLSVKTHKLALQSLEIEEFKLQELSDGTFLCTGYFANGIEHIYAMFTGGEMGLTNVKSFNTNGLLQFKMTPEGEILDYHEYEYPIELINQYETEYRKIKNNEREAVGKAGINDLRIAEIINLEDGSTIIIGEQKYFRTIYGGGFVHHFDDLIVMKLDNKGAFLWVKKLPKKQKGASPGGNGVKIIRGNGEIYILFLDNIKNANLSITDAPVAHSDDFGGGFLTAYQLDEKTGSVEKHNILNFRTVPGLIGIMFRPKNVMDTFPKTFMIEAIAKEERENAMVTFKLKE